MTTKRSDGAHVKQMESIILKQTSNYFQIMSVVLPQLDVGFLGFESTQVVFMWILTFTANASPEMPMRGSQCLIERWFPALRPEQALTVVGLFFVPLWLITDVVLFFIVRALLTLRGIRVHMATLVTVIIVNLFVLQFIF